MVQAATITTLLTVLAASFGAAQAAVPLWYQCGVRAQVPIEAVYLLIRLL